ncbi:MAG: aldehyde dehydrogenase family protein, partial [Rhodospirillales bacterium]|nr:aldehyde dehydrogenase family protein [Rhodospirillales bacterium]
MQEYLKLYIDGQWVDPVAPKTLDVINPATEEPIGRISLGNAADVDKAVAAARAAFESFSQTSREERLDLLNRIVEVFKTRFDDLANAISAEMGAPLSFAQKAQVPTGIGHFKTAIRVLKDYAFEETRGTTLIRHEPVGVCGLITPWNWPINQITCKVAPALAAGCTMVLKPSEVAPLNAVIFAEILHEAGVPAGVFNLVNGDGPGVGEAMSVHPSIDMMSFTGSTRAGIAVAKAAADTVKRVAQELGGKSANIILEDADFAKAVSRGVFGCMGNSGQSCNAPTRMLVPHMRMVEAMEVAKAAAEKVKVGDPGAEDTTIGPVVSEVQFNKIQSLIEAGIQDGAT